MPSQSKSAGSSPPAGHGPQTHGVGGAKVPAVGSAEAASTDPSPARGPRALRRIPPWLRVSGVLAAIAWGGNEFTPLLVMYRQEGLSDIAVDVLLGVYVLGIVPALLIGGPLSDRFGRRPLLIPAPAIAVLGSVLLAIGGGGSPELLTIGRLCSGVALGLAMAVGTSWIKELSQAPFDPAAGPGSGARRASLSLTAGFALGASVAAVLAQWAPARELLPYGPNIVLTLVLWLGLIGVPETRPRPANPGRLIDDLKVPAALRPRFLLVVVPMAPWVFGTAAAAYAILPALFADRVPGVEIAFSGLLCLTGMAFGFTAQQLAKGLIAANPPRGAVIGLATAALGLVTSVVALMVGGIALSIVAAAVLGVAFGLLLLSGLQEVQRIATPDDLAGLTAVYYSLTYVGFFVPALLSVLVEWFSYEWMLGAGSVVALACLAVVAVGARRTRGPAGDA